MPNTDEKRPGAVFVVEILIVSFVVYVLWNVMFAPATPPPFLLP
jgi:hypothetical protein